MKIIRSLLTLALYCKLIESNDTDSIDWCPNATCKPFGDCRPCMKRFLFIIAQGRSGGTTIKNMVNLLPGVRVSGEIGTTIDKMMDLWKYVRYGPDDNLKRGRGNMEGPWGHYHYTEDYLACPAQDLIESINPPENIEDMNDHDTIIGFKELNVYTKDHLHYLLKYFPCSRFIFSIRGDKKALKEAQRKHFGQYLPDSQNDGVFRLHRYAQRKGFSDRVYIMDMDRWSQGENNALHFDALARWLGFENCKYSGVLHDNRNVGGSGNTMDTHNIRLDSSCRKKGTADTVTSSA